jgi:hypothetical protein
MTTEAVLRRAIKAVDPGVVCWRFVVASSTFARMDASEFTLVFKASIRAWLNWSALVERQWAIRESFSDSLQELGDLFTVWFVDARGRPSDWRVEGARPLRVREALDSERRWSSERLSFLEELSGVYRSSSEPVRLVLPLCRLRDGSGLLVDGNHRTVAAFVAARELRLLKSRVEGPVDHRMLPDLWFFEGAT